MAVKIKQITTKCGVLRFVKFGNNFYKDCENFCPSLILDEMATFNPKKNPAFDVCENVLYMAYRNGKAVGRVAGIINHEANARWGVKEVRFGWIDFVDDLEVSKALLDAVVEWGKSKGMNALNGPVGFTDFDPEGMLVDGFDRMCTMALFYNHPYYPEHMKKLGYYKETGWVEYRITIPEILPEKHIKYAEVIKERYKLTVRKLTKSQIRKENYGRKVFELVNQTYCVLYGYSLLSEKQIDQYVDLYLSLADPRMFSFVENEAGELVAMGITIPSLSEALQKCNGEIFPFGWWHLLKAMYWKKPDTLDMLLIGVRPDYQAKGLNSLIFTDLFQTYQKLGFKYAETNANLETNAKVQAMWTPFEKEQHKKRWVFGKEI